MDRVLTVRGNTRLVESSLTVRIGRVVVAKARGGFLGVAYALAMLHRICMLNYRPRFGQVAVVSSAKSGGG